MGSSRGTRPSLRIETTPTETNCNASPEEWYTGLDRRYSNVYAENALDPGSDGEADDVGIDGKFVLGHVHFVFNL